LRKFGNLLVRGLLSSLETEANFDLESEAFTFFADRMGNSRHDTWDGHTFSSLQQLLPPTV